MKKIILKAVGYSSLAMLMLTVLAPGSVSAQGQNGNGLVGSWDVRVSIKVCGTDTTLFGFPAMLTYNAGGTMEESDGGDPALTRLTGHGIWERQTGRQYAVAYRWLNFNPRPVYVGANVVRSSVAVAEDGNSYTSIDTVSLILPNGTEVPVGCATTDGTRFH